VAGRLLPIYLQDHFAGASAGVSLARRIAQSNGETPTVISVREVAGEVAEDRETLKRLMHDLGVSPSMAKNVAAWLAERAARLLSLGIGGKIALWESLRAARMESAVDLVALGDRARDQRERVEQQRLAIAREALSSTN
jgi:hypothetical protein